MKEQDLLSPEVAKRLASAVSIDDIKMCYEVRNAAASLLWAYQEISRLRGRLSKDDSKETSEFHPGLHQYKEED